MGVLIIPAVEVGGKGVVGSSIPGDDANSNGNLHFKPLQRGHIFLDRIGKAFHLRWGGCFFYGNGSCTLVVIPLFALLFR